MSMVHWLFLRLFHWPLWEEEGGMNYFHFFYYCWKGSLEYHACLTWSMAPSPSCPYMYLISHIRYNVRQILSVSASVRTCRDEMNTCRKCCFFSRAVGKSHYMSWRRSMTEFLLFRHECILMQGFQLESSGRGENCWHCKYGSRYAHLSLLPSSVVKPAPVASVNKVHV